MAELTREQVLAMEAGPELDALIERRLFRRTGGVDWAALGWTAKRYSTDIALAWRVVERFTGAQWFVEVGNGMISPNVPDRYYCNMTFGDVERLRPAPDVSAEGPTAALAICRAAILTALTEAA